MLSRRRPRVAVTVGEDQRSHLGTDALLDFDVSVVLGDQTLSRDELEALLAGEDGLVRTWRGIRHEVTVLGDSKRFEYRGETYRSLTRIARVITGAHWSGPRFFGLRRGTSNPRKSS